MDSTLIVVCSIVQQILHPAPMDHMSCTRPMPAAEAQALMHNLVGARLGQLAYTLHPHAAPLSADPKPVGELKVDGNPEVGRVLIHWDSVTGGADTWSPAIPEDKAVAAIEFRAREKPVKFTNPVAYDLVKAN